MEGLICSHMYKPVQWTWQTGANLVRAAGAEAKEIQGACVRACVTAVWGRGAREGEGGGGGAARRT